MPSNNITFDPDSGVPYGLNLTVYGGSDFNANLNVNPTVNEVVMPSVAPTATLFDIAADPL